MLETFPRLFCFPKSRINENGGESQREKSNPIDPYHSTHKTGAAGEQLAHNEVIPTLEPSLVITLDVVSCDFS